MTNVWKDQMIAAGVGGYNDWKSTSLAKQVDTIIHERLQQQSTQNDNFEAALSQVMKMRQFLSSPSNILGSERTKHGEIAEHLEVNIRNAWAVLRGQEKVATFEGVGRTAPEDFILNGLKYQLKFINGTNNTLSHVLEHFSKYQDNSMNYSIPNDQFQVIQAIRNGQIPEGLSEKTARAIQSKIEKIELTSGRPFNEIVEPSIANYDEVQLGKISETVSKSQEELINENQKIQDTIEKNSDKKIKTIEADKGPSISEGAKVAGTAAAIGITVKAVTGIYSKVKSGKRLENFDADDWKEIGLDSAVAGGKAGLAAVSIYTLTNLAAISAPFAGAVTSAAMGITSLATDQRRGKIDMDEFVTQGQILCLEAGIAAIGGAIGQTLIPVPIIGSILGTVTANLVWGLAKGKLGNKEMELKAKLNAYADSLLVKIDKAYQDIIEKIEKQYKRFDSLIEAAFDFQANAATLAAASVTLAREVGVEENKILKNDADLEAYFLI
ncbi:hypothetical protein [Psychrobacillus sp. BM2]|uniref:hypothetical protein n=1 Tax=Psychrobacillus sp. BM2 TaxID=3400421 RepID=UPI003B02E28A